MIAIVAALALAAHAVGPPARGSAGLDVLIVGGGPNKSHNQVAIENNVKYVEKLLPSDSILHVLFADGDKTNSSVQIQEEGKHVSYRTPSLNQIDGPSFLSVVKKQLDDVADREKLSPKRPVMLYFTGHGSPNTGSNFENNYYDLWQGGDLSVRTLADSLKELPPQSPVTLVMVECFSGAFGNLIFDGANPKGNLVDRPICGFFASVPNRPAAGCTPEVNEANYRDFTSYFFAALTGTDRLGHHVSGADYTKHGSVTMSDAFAYSLIHDESIDTPVATTDVFLRRFVTTPEEEVFANTYADVRSWATPAQAAVLDALSAAENLSGDDRLAVAYRNFHRFSADSEDLHFVHIYRLVRTAKSVVLAHELEKGSDRTLKSRYRQLKAMEDTNPLKG
jgi:hypothetical protein